jgi:glycosyltransferase involved in cell wall biosynthesis
MKVSVIIPAFNVEPYLQRAVDSVFATKYPDLDILIVEDGSEDRTNEIANSIAAAHPGCVSVLRHPSGRNMGAGAARNVGIMAAKGEVVAFLDADDEYLPNRFDACIRILKDLPDVDGVYERTRVEFDDDRSRQVFFDQDEVSLVRNKGQTVLDAILRSGWTTNAITVRASVFDKVGLFRESLRLGQDTELWIRMSSVVTLVEGNKNEHVAVYRRNSRNRFNAGDFQVNFVRVLATVLSWDRIHLVDRKDKQKIVEFLYSSTYGRSDLCIKRGQKRYARKLLFTLGRTYPKAIKTRQYWGNVVKTF